MLRLVRFPEHHYRVTVLYREPTYELETGRERTYSGTFEVDADTPEQAMNEAVGIFKSYEDLSSVGWVREIVKVSAVAS